MLILAILINEGRAYRSSLYKKVAQLTHMLWRYSLRSFYSVLNEMNDEGLIKRVGENYEYEVTTKGVGYFITCSKVQVGKMIDILITMLNAYSNIASKHPGVISEDIRRKVKEFKVMMQKLDFK